MEMQKGSSAVIIISIIIALMLFIVVSSVGGYFAYKYFFAEEEEEEEEKKDLSKRVERDAQGFVDCGRITSSIEDFDDPFFDVDFDKDKAFVCMGKNINDNCSNAKSVMSVLGIDMAYKVTGSSDFNCNARFEVDHPDEGFIWAECSIPALISLIREEAGNAEEFGMILDKMEQGDGDYGASVFALMSMILDLDQDTFEQLGCTRSDN